MQTTKEKLISYLPGILLFGIALAIGLHIYRDYGISWDEPRQRELGMVNYDYIFNGSKALLTFGDRYYGAGFELPLIFIEKWMKLTDTRDIYFMRHLVSHLLFLLSALSGYFLVLRLFRNNLLACLAFVMFVFAPRIYAHSFFNSKDVAFVSMVLITLNCCQYVFEKNRPALFVLLGISAGLTTSIRIMGIMFTAFILIFLTIDTILKYNYIDKKTIKKPALNLLLFLAGFLPSVYLAWPYLWGSPIQNFAFAYKSLSQYPWDANLLFNGNYVRTVELPWTYFPTWFILTTPVLWVIAGATGLWFIVRDFFKAPRKFLANNTERNFLFFFLCFLTPVLAVIGLNSIIYDDWRHLYFVYPSFVLVGIYFFSKALALIPGKFRIAVYSVCLVQVLMVGYFMVKFHPFQQVYFNELVSHDDESLRENFELEYWGCSFKQALEHLIEVNKTDTIRVTCNYDAPLRNNMMLLSEKDRNRIQINDITQMSKSDYFITNFRGHREDYPSKNIEYSIKVLNSTIMCIFRLERKGAVKKAN